MSTLTKRSWRRLKTSLVLACLLAMAAVAVMGFATQAGAAALSQGYAPAGATGTGINAPPRGSLPLVPGKLWDAKNYRINFTPANCPQPPVRLADRLALKDNPAMLNYYGLPNPNDFKTHPAQWQEMMAHSLVHSCDHTEPIENGHPIINTNNINYNKTWSGFGNQCLNGVRCYNYYAADFEFVVTNLTKSLGEQQVSTWVGVGGANGDALSQTGVDQWTVSYQNFFKAFYESVQCPGTVKDEQDAYSVNTGDSMYFYTNYNGTDYLDDYTSNTYQSYTWGCGTGDGIEIIQERPDGTGGWGLADFDSPVTFHHAEWETVNGSWVDLYSTGGDSGSIYQWVLQGGSGDYLTILSWPTFDSPNGSTWQSWWKNDD